MRRAWLILAVAAVAAVAAACGSSQVTIDAVPFPHGGSVEVTVPDGPRSWSIVEDGDCLRLQVRARGRRYLGEPRCPSAAFTSELGVEAPEFRFNDRKVRVTKCPDNCAGPRPDVTMSAPVVWGRAAPEAGFVCVDGAHGPVVVKPDADGLVLAPIRAKGSPSLDPDAVLSFLADGRFIGTPGPPSEVVPAGVERCRAEGAPGRQAPEAMAWPLRIVVPPDLPNGAGGVFITTDTGYAPDGATLRTLAGGARIPLLLHPDTTRLGVSYEVEGGLVAKQFRLPRVIMQALARGGGCAVFRYTLVLRFDLDADPHLSVDDNRRTC